MNERIFSEFFAIQKTIHSIGSCVGKLSVAE